MDPGMTLSAFVGFSTPKRFNPVSWLVRKLTNSQCSHAWVQYYDDIFDKDMVMEAHELGFRCVPLDHFEGGNTIIKRVPVDVDFTLGIRLLASKLGNTYDYGGLIGMGWVELSRWCRRKFKWWHYKITNPLHWANDDFCSATVVEALQASASRMAEDMVPDTISPQELLDALT